MAVNVVIGRLALGQPLSFVCADEFKYDTRIIIFITTEALCVEVYVLLEMLSTGEAAVKHLVRFIWALGGPGSVQLSVIQSVPGPHTSHVLASTPESISGHSPVVKVLTARQISPHPGVLTQGGVISRDVP